MGNLSLQEPQMSYNRPVIFSVLKYMVFAVVQGFVVVFANSFSAAVDKQDHGYKELVNPSKTMQQ
jgi:hypothetical protein